MADDHRLMLVAVRRALADAEDFEIVSEVSVGSGVVPAVRETNPDVVLLDMRMPELDGLTCLTRLRKHDPTIAVVILSSYGDEANIEAARKAGALGYIVKTIEPVDLPAALRSALSGRPFEVWGKEAPQSVGSTGPVELSERESVVLEASGTRPVQSRDRSRAVDQRANRQVPPTQPLSEARGLEPNRSGSIRASVGPRGCADSPIGLEPVGA